MQGPPRGAAGGWKRSGGAEDAGDDSSSDGERKLYLKLGGQREASSAFGMDDLWLVSTHADSLSGSPTVVRSLWHGPGSSGMLEVSIVQPGSLAIRSGLKVAALRGPNGGDHLSQLDMLAALSLPRNPPILPTLLSPQTADAPARLGLSYPSGSAPDLVGLVDQALARFGLNAEQTTVLRRVADWLHADGSGHPGGAQDIRPSPVLLVHGA